MSDDKYWRDASGRFTFSMLHVPAVGYREVCMAISKTFQLIPMNTLVSNSVDIIFQDYRLGEQVVGLEWDNWMGFTVVSKTPTSESLVREIGAWLSKSQWATEL